MNVDVDEDEDMGEEDEVGPGCGILDTGITALGRSKLWIRQEYLRLYKYCDDHLGSKSSNILQESPSVVITGQPGIGKCFTM